MKIKKYSILLSIISIVVIVFVLIYIINMSAYYFGYPRISENDRLCFTSWTVYHDDPLEHKEIEDYLRKEISQLGPQYDVPWREVEIKQIDSSTILITVKGSWHFPENSDHSNLQEIISQMEGIDRIDEKVRAICA